MTENKSGTDTKRLTLTAHGIAGLLAGWTRYATQSSNDLILFSHGVIKRPRRYTYRAC